MGKQVGIWGWWQGNNLGDNWIRHVLSKYFPNAIFLPTSIQDFSEYDYIICGGGGLFIFDVISPFKKLNLNIPFGILGMGAEFEHISNLAVELDKQADFFYVRDQYSINCMKLSQKSHSYDVTFLDPLKFIEENDICLDTLFWVWRDGRELIENQKFNQYIQYADVKMEWLSNIERNFSTIVQNDFQTSDYDIAEIINSCGFVISGRYHGIIAAIQSGLPFIAIDICPKIHALVKECGLEKYCIKVSEVDKVDGLIKKAKSEIKEIRRKEKSFRDNANAVLREQIRNVKYCIQRIIEPLKVIHYGSYWMGENDVVNVMSDDLGKECSTVKINLNVYSKLPDKRIESLEHTPNGLVCKMNTDLVMEDVKEHKPDVIIFNSGGLCMKETLIAQLHQQKITTVGISLSDPDVFPYNGRIYASDFSVFYTNSKYSYTEQYDRSKVNIRLLPFAASLSHHYYMPSVKRQYDVIVVGHARKERSSIVSNLEKICNLGLYGSGWNKSLGVVNGEAHVKAINSGKMYLSFSQTMAGYENIKVGLFEAMACNQVVITSYMEELQDYFEIGKEILCYKSEEELIDIVKYYLSHDQEREKIRAAGYQRLLNDHTYQKRWKEVLRDIYLLRQDAERMPQDEIWQGL